MSTAALRLPVELPQFNGCVVGHSGTTLSTSQCTRMRRMHPFHGRGLSGSRESELSRISSLRRAPSAGLSRVCDVNKNTNRFSTFSLSETFQLTELQTTREDGSGRVPFNNRRHPHSPRDGLPEIGETGEHTLAWSFFLLYLLVSFL